MVTDTYNLKRKQERRASGGRNTTEERMKQRNKSIATDSAVYTIIGAYLYLKINYLCTKFEECKR